MDLILAKKRVLLLVSGGIAIYKSLDLISALKKEGAEVFVVMSEEATRFIAPLTFEAMSGNKVLCRATESFSQISHISYANLADIAIIAPATINTIAKLNYGIADNLIVETLLACKCAVFIAPSANVNMIESPQNKANLDSLKNMGYKIIPPRTTLLACNVVANGAMAEVSEIIFQLKREVVSGNSLLELHSADSANFECSQTPSLVSHSKFAENYESQTENPSVVDSTQSVESSENQSARSATLKALSGAGVGVVREGEGSDFAIQAPTPSLKKNARRQKGEFNADLSAESCKKTDSNVPLDSHDLDSSPTAQNDESFVDCHDSATPNLAMTKNGIKTHNDKVTKNFWHNKNIIITGGGSVEAIDSIRHISNDSSGKQASSLALAFYYLGANVTLIASKFPITLPLGVEKIAVKSSADFKNAIESKLDSLQNTPYRHSEATKSPKNPRIKSDCLDSSPTAQNDEDRGNILLMVAAISDFVPKKRVKGKLKKEQIGESWDLHLTQNEDILKQISNKFGDLCYIVGFKAESFGEEITQEAIKIANQNAKKMLKSKNCDMVVLNIISKSNEIGGECNEVRIFTAQDEVKIPQDSKLNISFEIAKNIAQNLSKK